MVLVLPARLSASAMRIKAAAERRGIEVLQVDSSAIPEDLQAQHLHAGPSFADVVGPALGIGLLEAPESWLSDLPRALVRRDVRMMSLGEAWALRRPAFVKSANDKSIAARVYTEGAQLPGPDAVDGTTRVLVSDVVTFDAEFRLFVLDGRVHTASQYAQAGELRVRPATTAALDVGADVLGHSRDSLPSAIVVDVGVTADGWAVVEANAAWACGTYAADPDLALEVILQAAAPLQNISVPDRPFLRRQRNRS